VVSAEASCLVVELAAGLEGLDVAPEVEGPGEGRVTCGLGFGLGRGFGIDVGVERCVGGCATPGVGTTFATGVGLETGAIPRAGIVRETSCVLVDVEYEDPGVERRVWTTFRTTA
jgi:hypothetical protein